MPLTLELSAEAEAVIRARAEAQGLTVEQWLMEVAGQTSAPASEAVTDRPIWEVIAEIVKAYPADTFAKLPTDGADQLDHHLYGHPRRP